MWQTPLASIRMSASPGAGRIQLQLGDCEPTLRGQNCAAIHAIPPLSLPTTVLAWICATRRRRSRSEPTTRAWIEANLSDELRGGARSEEPLRDWSRKLYDAGYAGLTWPKEYGGGGAPYSYQAILLEELARAEAPQHIGVIGLGMAGPTIIAHGTEEQKAALPRRRSSRPRRSGARASREPNAGSDLAVGPDAGRRRRRRVRRQRPEGLDVAAPTSPTAASSSARTDPDAPQAQGPDLPDRRHARARRRGPAAACRSPATPSSTRSSSTTSRVPRENLLGEVGQGWAVAMTTLLHERGTLGFALTGALDVAVRKLVALARRARRRQRRFSATASRASGSSCRR